MEKENLVAKAGVTINAPVNKAWEALTTPSIIKQYMFGTTVTSDWTPGSSITWKGEWEGKPYEDKGKILAIIQNKKLQYSHFSPMSGAEDKPENYHTVTIDLKDNGGQTIVSLSQDKNATEDEKKHSEKNWAMMLTGLKTLLEKHSTLQK